MIRLYSAGDGAALQKATVESYEHLRTYMGWAKPDLQLDEAEATVRRLAGRFLLNEDFSMGIWIGDELVGGTGFHLRVGPIEWQAAEIGMWIAASRAGTGLGTRALKAMLKWGFLEWGWKRIVWKCDTRNIPSSRVAEKGGMRREATFLSSCVDTEGFRGDMYLYAMTREEWDALRVAE